MNVLNNSKVIVEELSTNLVFSGKIIFAFAIHQRLDKVHVSITINDTLRVRIVTTEVLVSGEIWRIQRISNVFVRDVPRVIIVNILRENFRSPWNISSKRLDGVEDISSFPVSFFFSV